MEKILVTGASGALGLEVTKRLFSLGYPLRVMIHDVKSANQIKTFTRDIIIADARKPDQLLGVCEGIKVLISTLGKSLSLFKNDRGSYEDIDYEGNKNILKEAEKSGVGRVIFTSILGCSEFNTLMIAKVHYEVEKLIAEKFSNHTIFRPTGFFSGLNDLIILGKRGIIPVIGDGHHKTNSIHQKDLAYTLVDMLKEGPPLIKIGGPQIHTRKEMAEMIQKKTGGRIIHLPNILVKGAIPIVWPVKPSLFHNMDYFRFVTTRDMIGEKYGQITFKSYLEELDLNELP